MKTQYFKSYSPSLGRDMECKVFGHAGRPVLFIPCQDGRFVDFEGFHMVDTWRPWIESGQVMVFSIDTIDKETWSAQGSNEYWRIRRHEQWINYIVNEVVPFIHTMSKMHNHTNVNPGIMLFGCSMGASHSVNLFLRFPDIFDRMLALSGLYTGEFGFGKYMDELVYNNSPVHYMANMPSHHPYVAKYNRNKGVICCGQGAWEDTTTTFQLKHIFEEKGINIWVDLWGYDVNHDWPWWHKQVPYFLPGLLEG